TREHQSRSHKHLGHQCTTLLLCCLNHVIKHPVQGNYDQSKYNESNSHLQVIPLWIVGRSNSTDRVYEALEQCPKEHFPDQGYSKPTYKHPPQHPHLIVQASQAAHDAANQTVTSAFISSEVVEHQS